MAIVNPKLNEINCKIVYYGPGRSGKTTNLITIHRAVGSKIKGEIISINTSGDRTIFFDLLPMDLGLIYGMRIRVTTYTVPGQVIYNDTRKLVLRGVDGVVFVADSLRVRRQQNLESFDNLLSNLRSLGIDFAKIAFVLQYNKRDLDTTETPIMPIEQMERDLNPNKEWVSFDSSALNGNGVKDTFKTICRLTLPKVAAQLK
jgi:signal recognition particle receptor subunit beta